MMFRPTAGAGSSWLPLALVGFLLILLPILAVLQYRWIGEVSAAERQRLEGSLRVASSQLADDFAIEVSRLSGAFELRDGFPRDGLPLIERYQLWAETAPYSHIVRALYLLRTHPDKSPELYRVNMESGEMQAVSLPAELRNFRTRSRPGPLSLPSIKGMLTVMSPILGSGSQAGIQIAIRPFDLPPPFGLPPPIPALTAGWTVVELDSDAILKEFVPALVQRHFSTEEGPAYRIALVTADQSRVMYSSEGTWTPSDIATPDVSIDLFGGPPHVGLEPPEAGRRGTFFFVNPGFTQTGISGQRWRLLVKHRLGSLETAIEQIRRRNLAISFGILLVLGAGVVTVMFSGQRARTLGRLQMEFAAGVSHELRTPLAVIRSAAHNLRTGIVHDKKEVEEYATIVQDEAYRLSDMVDQVLLYSETQSGRRKYQLEPIDVSEVIERAVANLSSTLDMQKCQLTTDIDSDLPPVKADASALTQCVQNLLSNAFKYGRNRDTAQIEIVAKKNSNNGEVQLSVIDDGPGIDRIDRLHLFEPFYRGVQINSNVPGNGLGLHLVQRVMHSQGGRVTLDPSQRGARFTLHIPAS